MMKIIRFEIPDELHSNIKLHCKSQKIRMHSFMPELMDKGWQVVEAINGNTTNMLYNDDGSPQK